MRWRAVREDFYERFLTFETAKGMYMVPAGLVMAYAAVFHIAFVIQISFGLLGWFLFSEGLRKIFVNRTKQEVQRERLKTKHKLRNGIVRYK